LGVATLRIGLGLLGLLVVTRVKGIRLPRDRRSWLLFTGTALMNTALPFPINRVGEKQISSGWLGHQRHRADFHAYHRALFISR